jgi:hypothetical protein
MASPFDPIAKAIFTPSVRTLHWVSRFHVNTVYLAYLHVNTKDLVAVIPVVDVIKSAIIVSVVAIVTQAVSSSRTKIHELCWNSIWWLGPLLWKGCDCQPVHNSRNRACSYDCPCVIAGRECDPEMCRKCNARWESLQCIIMMTCHHLFWHDAEVGSAFTLRLQFFQTLLPQATKTRR